MLSTRTNRVTNMDNGLTVDQQKEVDALNLSPQQRATLVRALINSPELSVQEALEHLKEMGGI